MKYLIKAKWADGQIGVWTSDGSVIEGLELVESLNIRNDEDELFQLELALKNGVLKSYKVERECI